MSETGEITIRLVKSPIGSREEHKQTVRSLGLRKLGQEVTKDDTASIRGMVASVYHLVELVEAGE